MMIYRLKNKANSNSMCGGFREHNSYCHKCLKVPSGNVVYLFKKNNLYHFLNKDCDIHSMYCSEIDDSMVIPVDNEKLLRQFVKDLLINTV